MIEQIDPLKITIWDSMKALSREYGQKFEVTKERAKIWHTMLEEFSSDTVHSSVLQLLSTHQTFPPTIGEVRLCCIRISSGTLERPKASEAWGRVLKKIQGQKIDLSVDEKRALDQVGTIYDLKHSENKSLGFERFLYGIR